MRRRQEFLKVSPGWGIAAVIVAVACPCPTVVAQQAGGGLVPSPRKTREELVREWDLNSDGKIDPGEMEVAASRMRRERAELRLNSGIDPVTGLPRGEQPSEPEPVDADAAEEEEMPPVEDERTDADRDESKRLPGTRVPRPEVPGAGRREAPQGAKNSRGTQDKVAGAQPGLGGTRAAADQKRQPITGGVRAGGLPARAGYGAGVPAAPLNAGLPIVPKPRPGMTPAPPSAPAPARGGLVPAPRQPAPPVSPRPIGTRDLYDPY